MVISLVFTLLAGNDAALLEDLGSPHVEVRDRAAKKLRALGKAALPGLHELRESSTVAEGIIQDIVDDISETLVVEMEKPPEIHTGQHFNPIEFNDSEQTAATKSTLSEIFSECRFLVGTYECSLHTPGCAGEWIEGISERDGETFLIRKSAGPPGLAEIGDIERMARHLEPIINHEEANKVISSITGRTNLRTWAVGDRTVVRVRVGFAAQFLFHFDAKGRLDRLVMDDRPPG